MSFKDFRVLETIGKGSFASVYKVKNKATGRARPPDTSDAHPLSNSPRPAPPCPRTHR